MERDICEDCGDETQTYWHWSGTIMSDGSSRFLCDGCWARRSAFIEAHGYSMPNPKPPDVTVPERDRVIANRAKYFDLLTGQIEFLVGRGYHAVLRKTVDEFTALFKPLAHNLFLIQDLPDFDEVAGRGEIPLVPVFPFPLLSFSAQVELARLESSYMEPLFPDTTSSPRTPYLALGISRKIGTVTVPLMLEEGFSIATHFREKIAEWKVVTFPGSALSLPYVAISVPCMMSSADHLIQVSEGHIYEMIECYGYFSCSRRIFA